MKKIDARELACPRPVILAKDAVNEQHNEILILVGNEAAKENIIKFASNFNYTATQVQKIDDYYSVKIEKNDCCEIMDFTDKKDTKGKVIFIKSEYLGISDVQLGELLMKGFIYALTKIDNTPEKLIFMNGGVKLCIEGALTLENMKELDKMGVEILVCGTCLDFFKLTDKLAVGSISNMYDIVEALTEDKHVITI